MTINSKGINERLRVWNGTLDKTSGGLRKKDLKQTADGRIVSRKASALAKKRYYSKSYEYVREIFEDNQYT